MRTIEISDKESGISAVILPDYGGMMARLRINDRDVFFLDEDRVSLSPILAGGCPVLFPFPSRTKDDQYVLEGKTYSMPFHGLVKNSGFAVERSDETGVKLYATNSEAQKEANYPFDFRLELSYAIHGDSVTLEAVARNESGLPMPHYFGWHPYFTASDKAVFSLDLPMREYVDYKAGTVHQAAGRPDVSVSGDFVYYDRSDGEIIINNPADGYRAAIQTDEAFEVVTVCTKFDGCVCVEPWLGMPDSINTGKYVRQVPPYTSETYTMTIRLQEI